MLKLHSTTHSTTNDSKTTERMCEVRWGKGDPNHVVCVWQLRDLEQQLKKAMTQGSNAQSVEEEPSKIPTQGRNISFIRTMEKEKKEAFEVCGQYKCGIAVWNPCSVIF